MVCVELIWSEWCDLKKDQVGKLWGLLLISRLSLVLKIYDKEFPYNLPLAYSISL